MELKDHVIITGYTGVIGAKLYERLHSRGVSLILINSRGALLHKPQSIPEKVTDSVFDRNTLLPLFRGAKACVHLAAAQSGAVSDGVVAALLKNALLTDYFAVLAEEAQTRAFIYSSSGAIYYQFADPSLESIDESTEIRVDEKMVNQALDYLDKVNKTKRYQEAYVTTREAFGPDSVLASISSRAGYAFGKYAGEIAVTRRIPENRRMIFRLANAFGPGDHEDRIVPKFIRTARTGGSATVFDWSRNFIWINDLLDIIQKGIDDITAAPPLLNAFTPGNTITLWNLAQMINSMVDTPGGHFILNPEVHEPHFEFSTLYPEMLPLSPVKLQDGLSMLLAR